MNKEAVKKYYYNLYPKKITTNEVERACQEIVNEFNDTFREINSEIKDEYLAKYDNTERLIKIPDNITIAYDIQDYKGLITVKMKEKCREYNLKVDGDKYYYCCENQHGITEESQRCEDMEEVFGSILERIIK